MYLNGIFRRLGQKVSIFVFDFLISRLRFTIRKVQGKILMPYDDKAAQEKEILVALLPRIDSLHTLQTEG